MTPPETTEAETTVSSRTAAILAPAPAVEEEEPIVVIDRTASLTSLAIALEQSYTAAVPQQIFAFCRDPESAISAALRAASDLEGVQALSEDLDLGWRVASRFTEALVARADSPAAAAALNRLILDFDGKPDLMDAAIDSIQLRDLDTPLVGTERAKKIFGESCL